MWQIVGKKKCYAWLVQIRQYLYRWSTCRDWQEEQSCRFARKVFGSKVIEIPFVSIKNFFLSQRLRFLTCLNPVISYSSKISIYAWELPISIPCNWWKWRAEYIHNVFWQRAKTVKDSENSEWPIQSLEIINLSMTSLLKNKNGIRNLVCTNMMSQLSSFNTRLQVKDCPLVVCFHPQAAFKSNVRCFYSIWNAMLKKFAALERWQLKFWDLLWYDVSGVVSFLVRRL